MATATATKALVPQELPFLQAVCWQTEDVHRFDPEQMLSRYERGWGYRKIFDNLEGEELEFLRELAKCYHSWLQVEV
jgi:hypothetical protein